MAETNFNTNLLASELPFNNFLVDNELAPGQAIFGTDSALNGTVNRPFNVGSMFVDTVENTFNGILFGGNPTITESLTLGLNYPLASFCRTPVPRCCR